LIELLDAPQQELPAPITPLADADEALLFEHIASGIEQQGYAVLPAALPAVVTDSLLDYLLDINLSERNGRQFRAARIGRGADQVRNQFVRRDRIFWIDERHPDSRHWLAWAERLKRYLNRRLFLGLFSFESHFSRYREGDFYRKHLDAFKGQSNRVLSLVTYLNKGWQPDQGGELVLYPADTQGASGQDNDQELVTVQPGFATLVVFLSEEFPHEVRVTSRERYAVAGWYRINSSSPDAVDPPR
jgi:SM-20-related protein